MRDNKRWEMLAARKQQKKQICSIKRRRVVAKATRRLKIVDMRLNHSSFEK